MKKILKKILGDPQAKTLKRFKKRVADVNVLEADLLELSDRQLKEKTIELRESLETKSLDAILPEAFAVAREAARRVLGQRHFDVQLIGGMALHEGNVAEMRTGEGKTLVATLPVYLNALSGKGVHVVTVNDYLAQRDAGWMAQVYDALGLSTGVIIPDASFIYDAGFDNKEHDDPRFKHLKPCTRQEAYRADITYGTNNEYGFDYLRDNMVSAPADLRQRELNFAIVDEVDSILIDEARTPLIISAPSTASGSLYAQFSKIARQLTPEMYELDEKRKAVALNDVGVDAIEKILGISNIYADGNLKTIYHLEQALRAQTLFKRDKSYVVTNDGEVVIVDEFTGRLLKGRRYSEGLHQAIEAKEGVTVQEESMTLATISFQNYFRLYNKLSGMTGTANTEAEEFYQIYKLSVLEIPTNRDVVREDLADRIYKNEAAKFRAIVEEVRGLQAKGQPVLIGSSSIEKNEELSAQLQAAGIEHSVLNAKNNEKEANIVAKAGQKGAVTLATNIAGRGTDIVLTEETKELGGLFVLGSERHESRRIDNQLRGRSGRQGDPGTTQFFVSCEDDLMRIFGGERISSIMERLKVDENVPVQNRIISKSLEGAQKKVEGHNFDIRKNVVQYDDVMNRHRRAIYVIRRSILLNADASGLIKELIRDESGAIATSPMSSTEQFEASISEVFPLDPETMDRVFDAPASKFGDVLAEAALEQYEAREQAFGEDIMREVERDIYLQVLDNLWMQHLENMDHMREGIHWISVGQRDPLVEYRRQSQRLFDAMQQQLRHDTVSALFHARPVDKEDINAPVETTLTRAARRSTENADQITEAETFEATDFAPVAKVREDKKIAAVDKRKTRKVERQRKTKAKKRNK
jgi:preprotein translocase subunit SecA